MFTHLFESEEFQNKYKKYMTAQDDKIYSNLIESMDVILKESYATFDLLENLTKLSFVDEKVLTEAVESNLEKIQSFLDNPLGNLKSYIPVEIQSITTTPWYDEKGTVNKIAAFVKGIAKWLWSLVKVVFDSIRKFVVRAFGGNVDIKDTKNKVMSLKDALTKIQTHNREVLQFLPTKSNNKFSVVSNISIPEGVLNEAFLFEASGKDPDPDEDKKKKDDDKNKKDEDKKKKDDDKNKKDDRKFEPTFKPKTSIVTLDLKNEIHSLKMLTDHFLNIYDNSYGSNNENLFGANDLEVIINVLHSSIQDLMRGKIKALDLKTGYTEIRPVEAAKVRETLIQTNTNLENLKKVFSQTHAGIQQVGKLLNAKQMQALSVSPHVYKFLSMETYGSMVDIIDVIGPRIEEALDNQKKLELTKKQFSAIASELERLSPAITALGTISYVPEHQNRVINLMQATKYLTQIVQLRLGALTLYIRYLEEINSLLSALSIGGKQFAREFKLNY